MSRFYSYLDSTIQILQQYNGEEPFASFLKKFFRQHKKYGSKDRKQIAHLCYCYFRLGKAISEIPFEERILTGLFLCTNEPNELLEGLKPEWNKRAKLTPKEKCAMLNIPLSILDVFPWREELSQDIDHEKFCESFLIQPDLFLRVRPGYEKVAEEKLVKAGIQFAQITPTCLSLSNASKLQNIIELDKEGVVQDYNSQRTGEFFQSAMQNAEPGMNVWDCCAASGGKSILIYDLNSQINLTVSDVRKSIVINLKKRFARAGIKKYRFLVADLSQPNFKLSPASSADDLMRRWSAFGFELIICDAPCTGSGTWSRTPEQVYFFDERKIDQYAALQKKILSNVIAHLKPGGFLIYITCSVFKKENAEIAEFIKGKFELELIRMELLKGYDKKADTMFAALFKKNL